MEAEVGKITHYYSKIGVGVVELSNILRVGDRVHILGKISDFTQTVDSIQIERETVEEAGAGQMIGLKVNEKVRKGDIVYKIEDS